MSMYILDSGGDDSDVPSRRSPTVIIHDASLPMHMEEFHCSPIMEKVPSKRHSVIQEEYHPCSYNIEEIFGSFTFNLCRKEVNQKRVQKVKKNDGTMEEMQEDKVLFEKTDEDLVVVAIASTTLTQATTHNIIVLNEKLLEMKSENLKLKDEISSLREEMKKRRKVEDNIILLKEKILEQQEKLHDVKVECFIEIQKMEEKVKGLEKHLEIVCQINLKMESLQAKIHELDKWRSMDKNVPCILPIVKDYDIRLHTLDTNECREIASKFEEKVR